MPKGSRRRRVPLADLPSSCTAAKSEAARHRGERDGGRIAKGPVFRCPAEPHPRPFPSRHHPSPPSSQSRSCASKRTISTVPFALQSAYAGPRPRAQAPASRNGIHTARNAPKYSEQGANPARTRDACRCRGEHGGRVGETEGEGDTLPRPEPLVCLARRDSSSSLPFWQVFGTWLPAF